MTDAKFVLKSANNRGQNISLFSRHLHHLMIKVTTKIIVLWLNEMD